MVLVGVIYPFAVTVLAQLFFPEEAGEVSYTILVVI